MKYQSIIIAVTLFFGFGELTKAQSDSIMNKEVEVIKAFQPTVNGAVKIIDNPKIIDTASYVPTFDYKITSTIISTEKTINNLPVVKLGNPPLENSNTGYAKLGAGNAWTPYAEMFINTAVSKKTDFGMQLMHFSSRPNIKLSDNIKAKSPYSDNLARVFFKNYFRRSILTWDVDYSRKGYRYYGFPVDDTLIYKASFDSTLDKQALNTAEINFNLKNINPKAKIDYDIDLGYNFFWTATGQTEHYGKYNGLFSYNGRKAGIITNTTFEYFREDSIVNRYDNAKSTRQLVNLAVNPQYVYSTKLLILKAGLNLGTLIDSDTSALFHISPKLDVEYCPIEEFLTLFAGVDGGIKPANLSRSLRMNQYTNYSFPTKPAEDAIEIFGGFKGMISKHISYLFDINYSVCQNEAFYYLKQYDYPGKSITDNLFSVEYADVNILRLGGKLRYSSSSVIIDLAGNYYNHQSTDLAVLTHQPKFDVALNSSVQITNKINATLNTKIVGPREAKMITEDYTVSLVDPRITTTTNKLKTIIDINLGVEYAFSKKMKFFINASNLLNQNYEIWQGYNQPGLLIMLGASYTF